MNFALFKSHAQIESCFFFILCILAYGYYGMPDDRNFQMIALPYSCGDDRDDNWRTIEFRLDLNQADQSELTLLPRIGPALATRIVSYRCENNGFRSVDELLHVKGIGPKTLERIRPYCCITQMEDNDAADFSLLSE